MIVLAFLATVGLFIAVVLVCYLCNKWLFPESGGCLPRYIHIVRLSYSLNLYVVVIIQHHQVMR